MYCGVNKRLVSRDRGQKRKILKLCGEYPFRIPTVAFFLFWRKVQEQEQFLFWRSGNVPSVFSCGFVCSVFLLRSSEILSGLLARSLAGMCIYHMISCGMIPSLAGFLVRQEEPADAWATVTKPPMPVGAIWPAWWHGRQLYDFSSKGDSAEHRHQSEGTTRGILVAPNTLTASVFCLIDEEEILKNNKMLYSCETMSHTEGPSVNN